MLEKEYKYYEEHKKELLEKYKDRFIVIVNQKVISDYSSREEALSKTVEIYELGKFLIQKVTDQEEEIIQRFHSRVYV
jgi:hypothetical protein